METSAASAPACRICQGEEEPIIRPCRCEGTMAYAHPYCLAEWIAARGRLNCEVCGTPYSLQIAVQDPPSLRSIRGAARLVKLFLKRQVRGLRATLGVAAEVVGVLLLLTVSAAAIWYACWRCITRRSQRVSTRHVPFFVLWVAGFVLNAIPLAVLLLYERFHVWVFIHEDDVADLPPMPPQPQPTETPVDEAVAAARNAAFTTAKPHSEPRADHTDGDGGGIYVSVAHSAAASGSILELLRGKVKAAQKAGEKKRFWENTTLMYVAKFILVHLALAGAIVLGDVALQCLALCPPLLLATSRRLAEDSNSVALVLFREVLATATFSSLTYWGVAFLLGLAMLLVVLRLAATLLTPNHARLSRAVLLHCLFARGALAVVALVLVWVTVVPVVTYVCLFPFFVEGDATVLMPPHEAWQVLRSERLLPFRCHSAAATAPSTRPLSQPLNVARALLLAAPDVWRGRSPSLFDPVTCGLDAYRLPPPQHLSQAADFLSYCGCVLLRVCALPTWLALVGTLRATLLWLVTGAFAVLLPYTTLGGFGDGQPEFFAIFLHLPGRVFWRVLCEVPAMVALYAAAVGFPVFATLFHFFPQCFPRSLSYLSFFTFSNRFSEFDFVYTWYRIIRSAHTAVLSGLQRIFLSGDAGASAADAEEGLARHGAHVIERLAYGVCLLLANIFIGAVLEWTSWTAWFPLLGLFLNVGTVSWLGLVLGGGLHFARRTLDELRTRATMLCFYGTWITYGVNDVCIITKLSPPRINTLSASLMGVAVERQDMGLIMLVGYLHDEENTEPTMCFTAVLQRLTSYTLSRLATYPRMLVAALLTALTPLVLCSALQLDFVTPLSTDYVALPLWFSVLLRWVIGAAAGTVWVVVEGRVLRTALFQRCLRHAPEIILGSLSLEAVHAVAIPVVIHCAVVRLGMELLRRFGWAALNTAASTPREAMAAGMTGVYGVWWLGKYVARRWRHRALDRGTADNAQAVPLAAPQPPQPPVAAENAEAPQHQPATGEARPHPAPEAPAAHPAAEAAEGERVAGDGPPVRVAAEAPQANGLHQAPAPPPPVQEQPPPQQQQQRAPRRRWAYFTGLRKRISQWAASECATDVVLVSYTRDPSAPETA